MKYVKKKWGSEIWIHNDKDYCGKLLTFDKGFFCSMHKHLLKKETFYLQSGKLLVECFEESEIPSRFFHKGSLPPTVADVKNIKQIILLPGEKFEVSRGLYHKMTALENSELYEFSTQHFDSDSYRIPD